MNNTQCKNCHKTFKIIDNDQEFYNKIEVPEPTFCPDCRCQRRLSLRNELNLYQDKCDFCNKKIISLYSQDKPYKVYCYDCFWSDKWDAIEFGQDYDPNKSFLEQFKELQLKVPRIYAFATNNENSEYTNGSAYNKDCYMIFVSDHNENCFYSYSIFECKDSYDCLNSYNLESCYQCSGCNNCYGSKYSFDCSDSNGMHHCMDCKGCSDCFGCVGLRNKQNYFLNKELSNKEYKKRIDNISDKDIAEYKKLKFQHGYKYTHGLKNENATGDYINNCKDSINCYDSHYLENCQHIIHGNKCKDTYDGYMIGDNTELTYETVGSLVSNDCQFNFFVCNADNVEYCDSCSGMKNCFGCISLQNKEFCILNKQYSEEEFYKMKDKIIAQMKKDGEYGELWPISCSPFAYNETAANDFYPIKKEDAKAKGWSWKKTSKKDINSDLPVCECCSENFNLIAKEKKFYKQNNLPQPKDCFKCRHKKRLASKNPRSLWHRQCDCTQPEHGHAGRCLNEFETTYSPDRKELVYCGDCYKKEIY